MTVDDAPGPVTIYSRGRSGLFADDLGVTIRNFPGSARRFAWSEISCFADGLQSGESYTRWVLEVVLHTGGRVPVNCTATSRPPAPGLQAAVRLVAGRYGIPADLTGLMMRDRRPLSLGMYEDPAGEAGVRFWDGSQWSPLLPPTAGERWGASRSAARWADLPVSEQALAYPAIQAARAKVWIRVCAVPTAALLVAGLVAGLWSGLWAGVGVGNIAALSAMFLFVAWLNWRQWPQLEKRLKDSLADETPR